MMYELQVIDVQHALYKDIVMLRHDVLRKPLGLSITEDDLHDDRNQYIVVATAEQITVGCLLIQILSKDKVKFRQMAILPDYQKKRIGQGVIEYAENFCRLNNYTSIELHARVYARYFYEKLGYQTIGNEFIEVGIQHIKMLKLLQNVVCI